MAGLRWWGKAALGSHLGLLDPREALISLGLCVHLLTRGVAGYSAGCSLPEAIYPRACVRAGTQHHPGCQGRAAATQTTGSEAPSGTISFRGQLLARQQLPGSFGAVPIGPLLHGPVPGGCLLKGLRGRAIYGGDTLGRPVSGPTV